VPGNGPIVKSFGIKGNRSHEGAFLLEGLEGDTNKKM